MPWVRVYKIPSYVSYSHRIHLAAKNTCADCHGNVAESVQVAKEGDISMGGVHDVPSEEGRLRRL